MPHVRHVNFPRTFATNENYGLHPLSRATPFGYLADSFFFYFRPTSMRNDSTGYVTAVKLIHGENAYRKDGRDWTQRRNLDDGRSFRELYRDDGEIVLRNFRESSETLARNHHFIPLFDPVMVTIVSMRFPSFDSPSRVK